MILLIASLATAIVCSCLCSLLEAALLSITPSQLASLRQENRKAGVICEKLKRDVEKPIAVILIINTAAHTIGAAIAGSQFEIGRAHV